MAMNRNISTGNICTGNISLIEKILGLGLSLMTEDARKNRMERVVRSVDMKSTSSNTVTTIDGQALAALIDECRDALRLLVEEGNATVVSQEQLDEVKSMIESIDGKKAVASMDPDALVELVMEYRESVCDQSEK